MELSGISLWHYLYVSSILFGLGIFGVLKRPERSILVTSPVTAEPFANSVLPCAVMGAARTPWNCCPTFAVSLPLATSPAE